MTNKKKQQIIELLKDKEVADSIGAMSEGLVKLFESIPADEPEEKKPYDPGLWLPKADERYYEAVVTRDAVYGVGLEAKNGIVGNPYNCWETSKRAIEVGKKIKFLMLIERLRDQVGDIYVSGKSGWNVVYSEREERFELWAALKKPCFRVSPLICSIVAADKICDILNKMKVAGQLDWRGRMNTLTFTIPNVREPQYRDKRTIIRITPKAYNILEDISARTGLALSYIASEMIVFANQHTEIIPAGKEDSDES